MTTLASRAVAVVAAIIAGVLAQTAVAEVVIAPLPSAETRLERIAFGSCLRQNSPQPIWSDIGARKPQLMLMMGDNVYGNFSEPAADKLKAAYDMQAQHAEFSAARASLPMLAVWDDNDYGLNDGGRDFEHRKVSEDLFRQHWGLAAAPAGQDGIYQARTFGPEGQRVQIIMLDTRSFRTGLKAKTDAFPYWGRYEPDTEAGSDKTMLGAAQWAWLEGQLREPVALRIVVSSIQVLAEGHGWERWGNFPGERDRLLALIAASSGTTVLLSGDRHAGGLYEARGDRGMLVEATSSALNIRMPKAVQDTVLPPLVSELVNEENFGLLAIDWSGRTATITLEGIGGRTFVSRTVKF